MKVTLTLTRSTADSSEAIDQTIEIFSDRFADLCKREPAFELIVELAFCFGVDHPALGYRIKESASFSRDNGVFYTEVGLEYAAWIGDRWPDRVWAVAQSAQRALLKVHKTRLNATERARLSALIDEVVPSLTLSPPTRVIALADCRAHEDEDGRTVSFEFGPAVIDIPKQGDGEVRVLQPREVDAYIAGQENHRPDPTVSPVLNFPKATERS